MRYLIEGSKDGGLFAEAIEAIDEEDAERQAIERLCEAWGYDPADIDDLGDLGDASSVRAYCPEDYMRDAAPDLFDALSRMRSSYGRLHDFISDMVEGGRITADTVPDDYAAIVQALVRCNAADESARAALDAARGSDADLAIAAQGDRCAACGRDSIECSRAPCPDVTAERQA